MTNLSSLCCKASGSLGFLGSQYLRFSVLVLAFLFHSSIKQVRRVVYLLDWGEWGGVVYLSVFLRLCQISIVQHIQLHQSQNIYF